MVYIHLSQIPENNLAIIAGIAFHGQNHVNILILLDYHTWYKEKTSKWYNDNRSKFLTSE